MNKILVSLLMIGVVMGIAGAGTWAYFSDTEQVNNNQFTAGTLDLVVTDSQTGSQLPFVVTNVKPGDLGSEAREVQNVGTLPGDLYVKIKNVVNTEEINPESETDITEPGDLGANLEVALWLDVGRNGIFDNGDIGLRADGTNYNPSTVLQYAPLNSYPSAFKLLRAPMPSGVPGDDIIINWNVPSIVGNDIQGDKVTFDIELVLNQAGATAP